MTSEALAATTHDEIPAFFEVRRRRLFGVFTYPTAPALSVAVILLAGGGVAACRNRQSVRLSRYLAALGYHTLRFDYHGVGESEGFVEHFRLDEPFVHDLMGAVDWVRTQGIARFVLVGSCFGGRTALSASSRIDGLEGLAIVAAPLRDFEMGDRIGTGLALRMSLWDYVRRASSLRVIRGLFDPDRRRAFARIARAKWQQMRGAGEEGSGGGRDLGVSPRFLAPLDEAVRRGVPVLLVYGDQDDLWDDFERARSGRLGEILQSGGSRIEVATLHGEVHGFTRVAVQDAVVEAITEWLGRRTSPLTLEET